MNIGGKEHNDKALDVQGKEDGQSIRVPANGEIESTSCSQLQISSVHQWQAGYVSRPGIDDRSNIYFAAVEMTRMPVIVSDPSIPGNPIVFVNGAFIDMTGYTADQTLGRNCSFMQGKDTDQRTVAELQLALDENRAIAVDILHYKASGECFWNALFVGPVFDQAGKLLYHVATMMDVTSRHLTQQQHIQSQKMEAIGQLTAGIAHDFNNLLQIVSGNLDIAVAPKDAKDLQHSLDRAMTATKKAAKLTQQLLSFARKQRLYSRPVNVNELIVQFSEMLVATVGSKIELNLDLNPSLPMTVLDPNHLEMALLNVLINARDAMPDGGRVRIGTALLTNAKRIASHNLPLGTYISLCVHDNGVGMPASVIEKATEPFFTTKGPGTGLGLAMVSGFVEQSNGRLEIESEPGKGTLIHMIFPVVSTKSATLPEPADAQPDANGSVSTGTQSKTILIVDDSVDVAELAGTYLRSQGYQVVYAHSGQQAIEAFEENNIDMVFSDIIMKDEMNGLQVVEHLRKRRPDLPVLLVTGYMDDLADDPDTRQQMKKIPILTKPYRQAEVMQYVRAFFEGGPRPKSHHYLR